jgi:hypothetical protein
MKKSAFAFLALIIAIALKAACAVPETPVYGAILIAATFGGGWLRRRQLTAVLVRC